MTHDDALLNQSGERDTESRIPLRAKGPATLLVLREDGATRFALPPKGTVTIGRTANCDVVVATDPLLSRIHAEIRMGEHATQAMIVDLGSSNGTRVGKRTLLPHTPHPLAPDDVIAIGSTYIVLDDVPEPATRVRAHAAARSDDDPHEDVIEHGALARLRPMVERFAEGMVSVLLLGETGAGKDVLASMIHRLSPRATRPLVCLNCAALPEALLESELFGYERGAFTGANQSKAGILESAAGGTVFLDEVGEMPLPIQAKLLRVLDRREVLRLGANRPRAIDVRFLAATNRDLEAEVAAGRFRSDLYFRLAAAAVIVPPLRERPDEIAPLARAFAARACRELGRDASPVFSAAALARLERHGWPGNVRELKNAVERAVLLARGEVIDLPHLALPTPSARPMLAPAETLRPESRSIPAPRSSQSVLEAVASEEKARILETLERCHGNQTLAAKVLNVSRRTLVSRLSTYGLTRKRRPD